MELDYPKYQSGTESELLSVEFTDSMSTAYEPSTKTPAYAWRALAQQKANELKIEMKIKEHAPGAFSVAFLSASDCQALLTAMAPAWKETLIDAIKHYIRLDFEFAAETPTFSMDKQCERVMSEYDLSREDVITMVQELNLL